MSLPIRRLHDLAESCVFVKQSVGAVHCGPLAGAPLIPKLRGQFAEFLKEISLTRLSILYSPTCVGLRYGHLSIHEGFSRHRLREIPSGLLLWVPLRDKDVQHLASLRTMRPPRLKVGGAGILTGLSSPTPYGLGLDPD